LWQLRVVQQSLMTDILQSLVQAFIHCRLDYCNALLTHWDSQGSAMKWLQAVQNAAACLVSGLIAVTMPCHYCATFIGCQWDSELSLKLQSSFGSVSMALLQSSCKSYALKWAASVVVPDYGLRQLAACKRLLHNGALVTMGRQRGTVCQQHCETVSCHYTHSSGDWKDSYLQHGEHHPALLQRFCKSFAAYSGAII